MGCDIHSFVEIRAEGQWEHADGTLFPNAEYQGEASAPFPYRDYGLFGFLADVRNYSYSPVIAEPRGLPADVSAPVRAEYGDDDWWHSASWLTVAELLGFDYDQVFEDLRSAAWPGPVSVTPGQGERVTLREFLGEGFFERLGELAQLGDPNNVRVVFWFDN